MKLVVLSIVSFVMSLGIFSLDYWIYHYITPDGKISPVFQKQAGKPLITRLLGDLGVMFLFSSLTSLILAFIFGRNSQKK